MAIVKVLKWMGVGAVKALPRVAPLLAGGVPAAVINVGSQILGDVIQGAVTKAQIQSPEPGTGEKRAEIALAEVVPFVKVGILAAERAAQRDIDEDAVVEAVGRLIRAYADLLKLLGLRANVEVLNGNSK